MRICVTDKVGGNPEKAMSYFMEMSMGGRGFDVITPNALFTRNYFEIYTLTTNTAISTVTFNPSYTATNALARLSSINLPLHTSLKGDFATISLSAGAVIGYYLS